MRKKNAFDYKHVKGTTAWALLYKGEPAGKIVCNWTDNPNGSNCIMTVAPWGGPLDKWTEESITVSDGGGCGGYCKFSSAFHSALHQMKKAPDDLPQLRGKGERSVENYLESLGYVCVKIC